VRSFEWWKNRLSRLGSILGFSHIKPEEESANGYAVFYVTCWISARDIVTSTNNLTEELEKIHANVRKNLQAGYQQCRPSDRQDIEIMLIGGGPSLNQFASEVIEKRRSGIPLVTVNGSYNWAVGHNLQPSAQIMVDARPFMKRFIQPVMPACKYLLASQVHPDVFAALPVSQIHMWNVKLDDSVNDLLNEFGKEWFAVPGGSTVMLRALSLLRMLGFFRIHIYGFDSCLGPVDEHHAYAQEENDGEQIITVNCAGKMFRAHGWMVSQAQEFLDQMRSFGEEYELCVYGDGLIAHMIETGASQLDEGVSEDGDDSMEHLQQGQKEPDEGHDSARR
jgi:hypothetical protein